MTSVARADIEALVEWGAFPTGALAIAADDADTFAGTIAADDTDTAAGTLETSDYLATFAGPYDNLAARFVSARIRAGRDDLLATMQGRTMTLTVRDADGLFNQANPASPLYGSIDDRMHPVSLRLRTGGVWRARFYGLTRRVTWQPRGRKGETVIECVDLFYWLQRAKPIIAPMGPTTTGAAIGAILDSVQWIDPTARALATGDTIPDFSADGSRSALELIGDLLEAERGVFYVRGDGVAVYEDRYARLQRLSEATIADRMSHVAPEVDFDLVRNRVRVTRLDPVTGDPTYTAEAVDVDSAIRIGYSDFPEIQTVYLESDAAADALAAAILPLVIEPSSPIRNFELDGREADLLAAVLDLELLDRFTLSESEGGSAGDFHVERFDLSVVAGGRVSGSYLLSKASIYAMLQIAADDADLVVGTIAADDSDVGAGTLVY